MYFSAAVLLRMLVSCKFKHLLMPGRVGTDREIEGKDVSLKQTFQESGE